MKEFHIVFDKRNKLNSDLADLHEKLNSIEHYSIMFRIYAELMDEKRINAAIEAIEKEFPDAPYTGCTTAANVMGAELCKSDILIVCMVFESPTTKFIWAQFDVALLTREELIGAARYVQDKYTWGKAYEFICTMPVMGLDHFVECMELIATKSRLFGGGAINRQIDVSENWVFSKGNPISNTSFVAVVYGGDELEFCSKIIVGWRPLGKEFKITKAEKNVLYTMDNLPTFDAYQRYLKIDNDESFLMNSTEFPLLCRTSAGTEALRTGMVCNDDGSIDFAAKIDYFETARLTYGSQENIISAAYKATADMAKFCPEVLHAYSCFGRKNFLEENCVIDIKPFATLGTLSGFFTSGEIVTDDEGRFIHHNETLVVVGMREGKSGKMKNYPKIEKDKVVPLNRRLENFIGQATHELDEAKTQLEALVSEVEERRREADMANKAKTDFLANMSHEIRTPINAILGFDTMILREASDEGIIKYATDIHSASENLLAIINDILDLSKIESGKMEIVPRKYDLCSLVSDTMNMIRLKGEEKGLKVTLKVASDIPSKLYGDDFRIRQVLVNLLNNAIKYTAQGEVTLDIKGERDGEDEVLDISVKDTGSGIKEEDMVRLFGKFRRIEEGKNHSVEGTGLGMSITVMFLDLMSTKLNVESEYGKGSTFSFKLRQKVIADEPIGRIEDRINRKKKINDSKNDFSCPDAKILVVDDNTMNRQVIIGLLKNICNNIVEADGGFSCINFTEKEKYDLIFLDHMMPDLDGIETFHRMRASETNLNRKTPVVMLTANAISGAKEEYLSEGFEAFLAKPVEPRKLESMLKKYIPEELIVEGSLSDAAGNSETADETVLPEVNGIDNQYALSKMSDPKMVLDTMHLFVKSAGNEAELLKEMKDGISENPGTEAEAELMNSYKVKVHAMKSSAALIGGLEVSALARALEHAAGDGNRETVLNVTDYFLSEWKGLAKRLKEAIEVNDSENRPMDTVAFIKGLKELNEAIPVMDIDTADVIMKELQQFAIPDSIADKMESLDGAVVNIDIDMTAKLVGEIIEILK